LRSEKQGSDFFYQEYENSDNAQNDADPAHGDDGLRQPVEDAAPRQTV
jgi:hypothetical protein